MSTNKSYQHNSNDAVCTGREGCARPTALQWFCSAAGLHDCRFSTDDASQLPNVLCFAAPWHEIERCDTKAISTVQAVEIECGSDSRQRSRPQCQCRRCKNGWYLHPNLTHAPKHQICNRQRDIPTTSHLLHVFHRHNCSTHASIVCPPTHVPTLVSTTYTYTAPTCA